ncbi:MAG: HupE/UreJ family protein [Flavobacteriales bacterium]|jgi:hypothetical protein
MNELLEGFRHITDFGGYDHMLFILAMAAPFTISDWKKLLILVTAFTIGHSLTLALSASSIIKFNSGLIELLIPITIFITAASNVLYKDLKDLKWRYLITLGFGLIHGMGFSSYFRMMYEGNSNWIAQLFLFNCGVEIGQLLVLGLIMLLGVLATSALKVEKRKWAIGLSVIAAIISGYLILDKF